MGKVMPRLQEKGSCLRKVRWGDLCPTRAADRVREHPAPQHDIIPAAKDTTEGKSLPSI